MEKRRKKQSRTRWAYVHKYIISRSLWYDTSDLYLLCMINSEYWICPVLEKGKFLLENAHYFFTPVFKHTLFNLQF